MEKCCNMLSSDIPHKLQIVSIEDVRNRCPFELSQGQSLEKPLELVGKPNAMFLNAPLISMKESKEEMVWEIISGCSD